MAPETDNGKLSINLALVVAILIISFGILFVSVSRAGLEIIATEENINELRKNEVNFEVSFSDSTTMPVTYKLPEINTLPSSPFYGFKKVRDWLWLQLSQGSMNKAKISLILGDKKISETEMLFKNNQSDLAIEAGTEALDKLKYAHQLVVNEDNQEANKLKNEIYKAGFAYGEILKDGELVFNIDSEKYNQLVNDVNRWNESQKAEKENLDL